MPKLAKHGEELTAKACHNLRRKIPFMAHILVDKASCTVQTKSDTKSGQWVCISCGEPFQNNMQAHSHTESHKLAWWTGDHFEEA